MLQPQVTFIELHICYFFFFRLVPLNSKLLHFNSGRPGRTVREHSSRGQFSADLDAVTPMLENTLMHAHCKSNFYIKNAIHHEGYRLSSSRYYSHCIETASIIRNGFSMTDSVELK